MKQPRLRVQLRALSVIRHAEFGARGRELIERLWLRRAHVRRRDHSDATAAFNDLPELVEECSHTGPDDETDEKVDAVSTRKFARQLLTDRGLAVAVDEQFVGGQRNGRSWRQIRDS